jgi:hypothetical protein
MHSLLLLFEDFQWVVVRGYNENISATLAESLAARFCLACRLHNRRKASRYYT